ncbi:MAG: hypothetical protein AAF703_04955 [Cyanobacteria bacterium P01_D01_bin.105]
MRRLLLISLATLPLAGCQFFNRDGNTVVDVIESVESGEALEAIPNKIENMVEGDGESEDDAKAFDDPTVEGENVGVVTADLIKSTDPEARLKAATLSRVDPFATLVPNVGDPIILTPIPDPDSPAIANANSGAGAASNATTPPPVRVQPPNEPLVVPSPIATLPTVPQPIIAPTVSVSGIVQLGNEPYAIVRSGSEPERYVRVGDRIAGGSVRVKRIETLAFEPRVILEENGIEVPRPVVSGNDGGGEAENAADGEPVAGLSPIDNIPAAAVSAASGNFPTAAVFSGQTLPVPSAIIPANPVGAVSVDGQQPGPGSVPESLLLSPASDSDLQAVIPGFLSINS